MGIHCIIVSIGKQNIAQLFGKEWFFARDYPWRWQQAVSVVARGQAAMTIMGQFAESAIGEEMSPRLGFFPLPKISQKVQEVAPLEAFVMSSANSR